MVKANRGQSLEATRALPAHYRAVLLYGPDEGLIRERTEAIGKQVVADLTDPFRVVRLGGDQLKATPSLLADELAAFSMTGGRRLVRLDGASDSMAPSIAEALSAGGDSLLLVTADGLGAGSKLRKMFEAEKHLLAIACYADEGRDLLDLVHRTLEEAKIRPAPDAVTWLASHLGSDRMITRNELDKLILYKGADEDRTLSLADARACVGDGAAMTLSQIAEAVTGGEVGRLDRLIEKAYITGENPIAILRVLQSRLTRLHLVRGHMAQGLDAAQAASKLAPPVFFKERDGFLRDVRRWPENRLKAALDLALETELMCKSTGQPAQTLTARLCLRLAASVQGR
ncbi:DNA polymerase III subunit delta [Iodidimonas gelatinilytica]|uniref:DNA-directed DNA polymerase n=1 Tax=Iodidimonas gelatinilytica TaxID=1236966 RepID=A0A5A7MNK1_9PROT|nr:DNA polymerase III subunit delta [Iodidimonas gelatinilytica]GEQ97537.1 DNA polymerase III subunit delta [Iodidimonas gelatinilytica]GER01560.1 DNA polymerase III subunit delta [Iodidimonas gelatinilytica]